MFRSNQPQTNQTSSQQKSSSNSLNAKNQQIQINSDELPPHMNPALRQKNLMLSNQTTQYFSFKLKDQIQTDATVGWKYNVPVLKPNQKNLYLCTQVFTTTLKGYVGEQYPQTITVGLDSFSGFINSKGLSTNRIIVLNLYQTQTYVVNGILYKDLIYKNDNSAMWNLGSLRTLKFYVYVDQEQTPINFPITNPLALSFKILHVSM